MFDKRFAMCGFYCQFINVNNPTCTQIIHAAKITSYVNVLTNFNKHHFELIRIRTTNAYFDLLN